MRRFAALTLITSSSLLPTAFAGWQPALRTEVRVTQDSNVFLQDPTVPLMAGQTSRGQPGNAADTAWSGLATVSLSKKAATPTDLAGDVSFGAEYHHYDTYRSENHHDFRFGGSLKQTIGAWTHDGKLTLLDTHGSHDGPVFNELGGNPALGGEPVRARRDQTILNASASSLWKSTGALRIRPMGTLLSQDFHTRPGTAPTGYTNYSDRGQAIAGLDVGAARSADVTFWTSVRVGRQWQGNVGGRSENFTNSILRPLVGFEGKVSPTFKLTAWAGPDFRRFTAERRAGVDRYTTGPYFEVNAAWTPTKTDIVGLIGREHIWVGGSGRSAYRETKLDATWTHRFSPAFDATARAGIQHGNFHGWSSAQRHEQIYTGGATLGYAATKSLRLEAFVNRERAENEVINTAGRAYSRWLTGLSAICSW